MSEEEWLPHKFEHVRYEVFFSGFFHFGRRLEGSKVGELQNLHRGLLNSSPRAWIVAGPNRDL